VDGDSTSTHLAVESVASRVVHLVKFCVNTATFSGGKGDSLPPCRCFFSVATTENVRFELHFYQFHIGDYASHTRHLSLMEDLAYRRLLDYYYLHEIPIKQRDIARMIGMREHEQDVLTVLNEFFLSTDDGFISPRANDEIAKYRKFSEDGKRGAAKRWHKDSNGEAISPPNATPMATNNQEPITNNHKPKNTATVVACPPNVSKQVWEDWKSLRKGKGAKVSATALEGAENEARKAGMSLEEFLKLWCLRGSQGLMAEWVLPKVQADVVRMTVPRTTPDPTLERLKAEVVRPPSLDELAKLAALRRKA